MNQTSSASQNKGMAGLARGFYEVAYELTLSMSKRGLVEGARYKYTASAGILLNTFLEAARTRGWQAGQLRIRTCEGAVCEPRRANIAESSVPIASMETSRTSVKSEY